MGLRCFGAALGGRDRSPPCRRCRRAMGCEAWPSSSPISATVSAGRGAVGPGLGRAGPCRAAPAGRSPGVLGPGCRGGFPRPPPLGSLLSPWPPRRAARGSAASRNGDAPRGGGGRCGGGRRARGGQPKAFCCGFGVNSRLFWSGRLDFVCVGGLSLCCGRGPGGKGVPGGSEPVGDPKGRRWAAGAGVGTGGRLSEPQRALDAKRP